jgi:ubiquinone/menaquinone biosynthesis C-methylase UbiE
MGYEVTAVDISKEMCQILESKYCGFIDDGRLTVVAAMIEDMAFRKEGFDLIVCYSVLHHLPDYVSAIRKLAVFLKTGGIMFLDHEASPYWWARPDKKRALMRSTHRLFTSKLNNLLVRLRGNSHPSFDYSMADYWVREEHHVDHQKIIDAFREESFSWFKRQDYYRYRSAIDPLFHFRIRLCQPDTSMWIAKK